jgi:hypothetical protein
MSAPHHWEHMRTSTTLIDLLGGPRGLRPSSRHGQPCDQRQDERHVPELRLGCCGVPRLTRHAIVNSQRSMSAQRQSRSRCQRPTISSFNSAHDEDGKFQRRSKSASSAGVQVRSSQRLISRSHPSEAQTPRLRSGAPKAVEGVWRRSVLQAWPGRTRPYVVGTTRAKGQDESDVCVGAGPRPA